MNVSELILHLQAYAASHPSRLTAEVGIQHDGAVFLEFRANDMRGVNGALLAFEPFEKGTRYTLKEVKLN